MLLHQDCDPEQDPSAEGSGQPLLSAGSQQQPAGQQGRDDELFRIGSESQQARALREQNEDDGGQQADRGIKPASRQPAHEQRGYPIHQQ